MATQYLTGWIPATSFDFGTDNVIIGDTWIYPDVSDAYAYLSIVTSGSISITGNLTTSGNGWIGAAGASNSTSVNNGVNVGGAINQPGGYLLSGTNGDPFSNKLYTQMSNYDISTRMAVYPGGGGGGGSGSRGGGGGSGGGYVSLKSGSNINITGKIETKGLQNGGNAINGQFVKGAPCPATPETTNCRGTWYGKTTPGDPVWICGSPGQSTRTGTSLAGSPPPCCKQSNYIGWINGTRLNNPATVSVSYVAVAEPTWKRCSCSNWANTSYYNPPCKHDYGAGCCHDGRVEIPKQSGCDCNPSNIGAGGAGGGLLLYTSGGSINFSPSSIDLRGAHHSDTNNSGTLKIFHVGKYPNWVNNSDGYTMSKQLANVAGGLYLELLNLSGYNPYLTVPDLTSISSRYPANSEIISLTAYESAPSGAYVPRENSGLYYGTISFKYYSGDSNAITAGSEPEWTEFLHTAPLTSGNIMIGPTGTPSGVTGLDMLGRTWTLTSINSLSGWYLLNPDDRLRVQFDHDLGADTHNQLGSNIAERNINREKIFYTERRLLYGIVHNFNNVNTKSGFITAFPMYTNPSIVNPQLSYLDSTPVDSDIGVSPYSDTYWSSQGYQISNVGVQGFDDISINANIPVYWGSFRINNMIYNWGDGSTVLNTSDVSVASGTPREITTDKSKNHVYNVPTVANYNSNVVLNGTGNYKLGVSAIPNVNVYTGSTPVVATNLYTTTLERWPTPIFYGTPYDIIDGRYPEISKSVGSNTNDIYSENYIISGYEHGLNVWFNDVSISRSFPISLWTLSTDDINDNIYTITGINLSADSQVINLSALSLSNYSSAGWYKPVLTVKASTSNTTVSTYRYVYVYPLLSADFVSSIDLNAISGYVPISATFTGNVTAFTYPISTYNWNIYDNFDRTTVSNTSATSSIYHNWMWHTHDNQLSAYNNICLTIGTSALGHKGTVHSGLSTEPIIIGTDSKCKHLILLEKPPVAAITLNSSQTVSASYSYNNPVSSYYANTINGVSALTGYAPYVTVSFTENATANSYPISSYTWDFGDYFADVNNISSINVLTGLSAGYGWDTPISSRNIWVADVYPEWRHNQQGHIVTHTYTMPGDYYLTLTTEASTTGTAASAIYLISVKEILPICNLQAGLSTTSLSTNVISGYSPLTVYFTLTGVTMGSFPIGRVAWDFDDGSDIVIVDRYTNNYNNSITGSDPLWYNNGIMRHTFRRSLYTDDSTFNVKVSVYNDKTYNYTSCTGTWTPSGLGYNIGPILLPDSSNLNIIKSREYSNNEILVLQDSSTGEVFTVSKNLS